MEETKIDHLGPIKKTLDSVGLEMPDMVATGDLSVNESSKKIDKPFNKRSIKLPLVGSIFMHNGEEFKVVYINEGQHRFTCEPYKGDY